MARKSIPSKNGLDHERTALPPQSNRTSADAAKEPSASSSVSTAQRFAQTVTKWTGSTPAFAVAFGAVAIWAVTGPVFHYSDTWQLVMNTASSIVTFLMVFLIQRSQNKDALAMHVKLNEIVKAVEGASNRMVDVEDLSESELRRLEGRYQTLAKKVAKSEPGLTGEISVENRRVTE
jgi:low affinity Fe/Cu permease